MPLGLAAIRVGIFALVIGISAVTIALAAHYRSFTAQWGDFKVTFDLTYEMYPLVVGAINVIVLLPSIIIFFVRNPTTPPLWVELLITFILAILWLAVGLRVVTLHLNNWPCSIYKQFNTKGLDFVSICREIKVLEFLGFAAFTLLMIYILIVLFLGVREHMKGEKPWTNKTHELQAEKW